MARGINGYVKVWILGFKDVRLLAQRCHMEMCVSISLRYILRSSFFMF